MLIKDILRSKGKEIFKVDPDQTVYEAIKEMAERNIGALLVMKNHNLEGIISERDYRDKVILKGRTSKTTRVAEIMTGQVICASPDYSIKKCLELMTDKKFRHLPVMQDNKVVGVVSIGDLVKAIISEQKVEINDLKHYIKGTYPS